MKTVHLILCLLAFILLVRIAYLVLTPAYQPNGYAKTVQEGSSSLFNFRNATYSSVLQQSRNFGGSFIDTTIKGVGDSISDTLVDSLQQVQSFLRFNDDEEGSEESTAENNGDDDHHTDTVGLDSTLCNDVAWCHIPMPKSSHFRFDRPPANERKWRRACSQAASGEQVLLKQIMKHFPNHQDFLDGDKYFRQWHIPVDIFIDHNRNLSVLSSKELSIEPPTAVRNYSFEVAEKYRSPMPRSYDAHAVDRATILKLGYFAFSRNLDVASNLDGSSLYFQGPHIGEAKITRRELARQWASIKNRIDTPFILIHSANENWGFVSTHFPNRTEAWDSCCDHQRETDIVIHEILDHPQLLLFIVNQHHNLTHPKLISAPRGMPIYRENGAKMMWDAMRTVLKAGAAGKKSSFVFTSASKWKHRPYISACIRRKFSEEDFEVRDVGGAVGRYSAAEYYQRLASARIGISLPGMGYDCFRLWESLTIGTVPVLEKGIGLDKALWRLPALLVDDFDEVTPELLRSAYVEALYRAEEFEFERLTQSFWWSFIMRVSETKSADAVLDTFPLESEDPTFTRPLVPFQCTVDGKDEKGLRTRPVCGPGTKRTPLKSCPGQPRQG